MSRTEFRLPDVGEGLSEAEIVEWHVQPGGRVTRDQPIVDVETDKSIVQLPSPVDGVVLSLGAEVGDVVGVGAVLVTLEAEEKDSGKSGATGTAPEQPSEGPAASDQPAPVRPGREASSAADPSPRRVLASPATRKLALELGVDLSTVRGSGPGGRVTKDDVMSVSEEGQASAPAATALSTSAAADVPVLADEVVPLRGLRRQIARSMTRSWSEVPHITEFREVDATALVAARATLRPYLESDGAVFTYLPLIVRAVAASLRKHPRFNASLDLQQETITHHGRCNIGLATSTEAGLIVPVLKDADRRSLREIAADIDALAAAARARTITTDQTAHGTFTITNYGSFGGWLGTPIIRPPEAAIAGFGRIRDQVVAVDGVPVVRPTLPLSVSADHRLIDGSDLGAFVTTLAVYLTEPILLLEAM